MEPSVNQVMNQDVPRPASEVAAAKFPVVGIGASAGGLEALEELLGRLSTDGIAYVIVQHLAPERKSHLTEILARRTRLSVTFANDGTRIEPNHVYVAPPGMAPDIRDDVLWLRPLPSALRARHSIDEFFQSLAADRGDLAVGVILSGAGSDGTIGLRAIKEAGGITFVQHPATATQSGMPQSALDAGTVDFCLTATQIGDELMRLAKHPYVASARPRRRVDDLFVGATRFFRDPGAFEALRTLVFPRLLKDRQSDQPIRIWVAGCSTGEEAYSIAICLLEYLERDAPRHRIQIFATDIDEQALARARHATYSHAIESDVSPERLQRFFAQTAKGYQLGRTVRDTVIFARHNLVKDPPFSRLDLVSCRNVLIDMQPVLQQKICRAFHYALNPGGFLLLGEADTVADNADLFALVDDTNRIYAPKGSAQPRHVGATSFAARRLDQPRPLPTLPSRAALNVLQVADRRVLDYYGPCGVVLDAKPQRLAPASRSGNRARREGEWRRGAGLRGAAMGEKRLLHDLQVHKAELEAQNLALREAQSIVEQSRREYVELYDFAPVAYCTFSRSGVVRQINLTGATLLGKERSRIIGSPFVSLVRLTAAEAFFRHLERAFVATTAVTDELAFSTKRGTFDLQVVSTAVRDAHGSAEECRSAFLDITQQRRAERSARAAHASEQRLRRRLEYIDRASAAVSEALAEIVGDDISAVLQTVVDQARDLAQAEYAALMVESAFSATLARGVTSGAKELSEPRGSLRVSIRHRGDSRGLLYLAKPRGDGEFTQDDELLIDRFAERVSSAIEIARLRQVEAREHARLELLAKAGPLLTASMDHERTVATLTRLLVPDAADFTAVDLLTEQGTMTRAAAWHPDPETKRRLENASPGASLLPPEMLRAAIDTARPQLRGFAAPVHRDGDWMPPDGLALVSAITAPLVVRQRVVGLLHMVMAESGRSYSDGDLLLARDIAHHAALALEAARQFDAALRATQSRDALLDVVSHDLVTYLSTIRFGAELLSHTGPAGERRRGSKHVDAIRLTTQRMEQLVASLRDVAMLESGTLSIAVQSEEVAPLLEEARRTLEPLAEASALTLVASLDGALPPVLCDKERILQVIANLVGNAIKFTAAGGIIALTAKREGDTSVRVSVSDSGRGIAPQFIPRVFDRHWHDGDAIHHGSGLGLFIAKGIVTAHGGRIWVDSQVAVGSTFSFTLPTAAQP